MALATRKKPNAHDRKRQGAHHRHDKRYMSSYWPYLPMLLVVGLGLFINSALSHSNVLGSKSDFSAITLLNSTNAERIKKNEKGLTLDSQLTAAAQAKADDMVRNNYWAHNSPTGKTPWTFIGASGYRYQSAGENLAYGFQSGTDSVAGWMGSPEHRANILDTNYQNVGFGVATSMNFIGEGPETIVVAEYGEPLLTASSAAPSASPVVPPSTEDSNNILGVTADSKPVTRIQVISSDNSQWALIAVIAVTGIAMVVFVLRHGYRVHRLLNRSEIFIVHHPYIDVAIVIVITAGVILTRSSGIIH